MDGVFSLIMLAISATQGYNLNEKYLGSLVGDGQAESLFGWSLQHFQNDTYVGAPREGGTGAVYRCTNMGTSPSCSKMSSVRLMDKSWYGGSLAASDTDLYTCAFRHGYKDYSPSKQYIGRCFKKKGNSFEEMINFQSRWTNTGGDTWKTNGVYGVSATVSDKAGKLVVGTPITFDSKGMWNNPYLSAGSIGLVKGKNALAKPISNAPWVTKENDIRSMKNTFKNAGYSLGSGMFFNGNPKSLIVGAPKANNYKGSVSICHNCFGKHYDTVRMGVGFPDSAKNLEVLGLQMGESFGAATSACDITGDGRDDLIVGAPTYSPSRKTFNSGRIHIFLKFTQGKELRRVWPEQESTIEPTGDLDEKMGARFGSAVACLGDTDGDGSEEVVVGAPYFDKNGAIFLYRAKKDRTNGLMLSQILTAKEQPIFGFGMKLSTSKLSAASTRGFAVGAPAGRSTAYIKVRNVPRFTDVTHMTVMPRSVDPRKTKSVLVTVNPSIQRRSKFTEKLTITAKLITDSRLVITDQNNQAQISRDSTFASPLTFNLIPNKTNFGLDIQNMNVNDMAPLIFRISLEYKLDGCSDSYQNPCPVFDPEDTSMGQKTERKEMQKISKTLPDQHVDFNICKDASKCQCDIKATIEKEQNIVAGATTDIHMGTIIIENVGQEPSFYTNLEVKINRSKYRFLRQINCIYDANIDKTICSLPFFNVKNEQNSKRSVPLKLSSLDIIQPDTESIKIEAKLTSKCENRESVIVEEELEIHVKHEWKIKAEQRSSQEFQIRSWDQKNEAEEKEESESVELSYSVYNDGPSMSQESKLYAYIPDNSKLLNNIQVMFNNKKCELGDKEKNQTPPPPPNSDDQTELLVCKTRAECKVFECELPKGMEKSKRAPFNVKFDFVKKNARHMEKVSKFKIVNSICTMSHNQGTKDRCETNYLRTTTSFEYIRATTLDLLIASWQLVVGGIAALIVFLIVFIIFYKCELFTRVRFYKNMEDTNELIDEVNADNQAPSDIEVDGENIELRT